MFTFQHRKQEKVFHQSFVFRGKKKIFLFCLIINSMMKLSSIVKKQNHSCFEEKKKNIFCLIKTIYIKKKKKNLLKKKKKKIFFFFFFFHFKNKLFHSNLPDEIFFNWEVKFTESFCFMINLLMKQIRISRIILFHD